ncbi:hypothetical protein PRZ48_006021 [Zasmidium cellare]|uniref:Cytochrome P450 n=1 Tax=Zasmidium cellare TaxID=395010 RepID=A0ABR0EM97_ZASCE|nr:hypothetical protein PRZ48_006021 [Zasmidium cellare]
MAILPSSLQALPLPNVLQSIAILSTLLILIPLLILLYNLTLHPLATYPGPLTHRSSRLSWVLALQRGTLHADLLALHNTYGPIVRVAPNELSYTDPQAWKDIYLNPRIARADLWFRKQDPKEPYSIMGANEEAHARFKRAFMGGFSEMAVRECSVTMEGYVSKMMGMLRQQEVVDLVQWLNMVTFDVSGDLSFGSSFGSTVAGKPHEWVEISNSFGVGIALMASLNHYHLGLMKLLKRVIPARTRERMLWHKQLTHEKVGERLRMEGTRRDFVQCVLDYNRERSTQEKGRVCTPEEIELNMSVLVFAGSETTSTALASTLWYLLRDREWLDRVVQEVRQTFSQEEDIQMVTTSKMPILNAVISEGMRLGPPSAISVPRIVGKGGEVVCGKRVPEGTLLAMNQYAVFRSASNFPSPHTFDPSRFMGEAAEKSSASFYPFLLGRHGCIGEKFAWAEMRVILARLFFNFDVSLTDTSSSTIKDWGEQKTFIFWQKEQLEVKLKAV